MPHNLQGQVSPSSLPRMQRTASTPSQPQPLSSWRPDLPDEATQDSGPSSSPQSFSQQPLPSSSPSVHAMPSRTPSYRTTGTEPVCPVTNSERFSAPLPHDHVVQALPACPMLIQVTTTLQLHHCAAARSVPSIRCWLMMH